MSGKGSTPRPFDVDEETFAGNWAKTFGRNNANLEEKKEVDEQQSEQERTGTPGQG